MQKYGHHADAMCELHQRLREYDGVGARMSHDFSDVVLPHFLGAKCRLSTRSGRSVNMANWLGISVDELLRKDGAGRRYSRE